jgi:TPR repeat protein
MLTLARVHSDGWLLPRDYRTTVQWLRRAARTGSAAAKGALLDIDQTL